MHFSHCSLEPINMNNIRHLEKINSCYSPEIITVPRKRFDRLSSLNIAEEPTLRLSFFEKDR